MADDSAPPDPSQRPPARQLDDSHPPLAADDVPAAPSAPAPPEGPRHRRPVYEPSLLPRRKRRRASPWVVLPSLLLVLAILYYVLLWLPHQRRYVNTVGKIVFSSDQGTPGVPHLWIAGADGGQARRLTSGNAPDTNPVFSPDGSQVAFLSTRAGGQSQVFLIDADGKDLQQVTRSTGTKTMLAFAPSNNSLVGYVAAGILSTANIATGETDVLLPAAAEPSQQAGQNVDVTGQTPGTVTVPSFAWTPTADRAQQGMAAVVEDNNTGLQALILLPTLASKPSAPRAAADTMSIAWSPEGGLLAVAMLGIKGLPQAQQSSGMILFDAQGNPLRQPPVIPITQGTVGPENPVFSPDGTQIVFEVWDQPDLASRKEIGLFRVQTDGSAPPAPVYKGTAEKVHFLPDGNAILFLKPRRDGGHDLCRVALDGTGFQRLSDGRSDISDLTVSQQAPKK